MHLNSELHCSDAGNVKVRPLGTSLFQIQTDTALQNACRERTFGGRWRHLVISRILTIRLYQTHC